MAADTCSKKTVLAHEALHQWHSQHSTIAMFNDKFDNVTSHKIFHIVLGLPCSSQAVSYCLCKCNHVIFHLSVGISIVSSLGAVEP